MVKTKKVTFAGAQGDKLAARLDLPDGEPKATALFAHCFTCTKDIFAASRIAQGLAENGFAVLRFDFTGLGSSEGEFANTNFSSNVQDLVAAADFLRGEGLAPNLLVGHSLGGAAVLAAAESMPEVKAVATIGAPYDPGHVAHNFGDKITEINEDGEAEVILVGRPFRIKKQFLDDIGSQNQKDRIANLGKALVVFHSPIDATVGVDNAAGIFAAAKHPKSFISLDHADHLLSRREDAEYVAMVLAAWASRYVVADQANPATVASVKGAVVVEETSWGKFQNTVAVGPHHMLADEPESVGGNDTGLTPYDFVLSGLGACTNMTLRMYAERKGLKLEKVRTVLHHEKIHADDCADCETKSGKLDKITRTLTLYGDLSAAERARLLEIADMCPVHRTLHNKVVIETTEGAQ